METAGGIFGRAVGPDQLCDVLVQDLRGSRFHRAHVVVGGVGAGKTALLVLLTERLARQGAVPVPLRLRGVQGDLDFRQLAYDRFRREVQGTCGPRARRRRFGGGCAGRDVSWSSRTGSRTRCRVTTWRRSGTPSSGWRSAGHTTSGCRW
ncbi:hypothetical protein AB0K80_32185 [Streptomyces sp. NPDC052682]|uniref:hypothetical protein n=1 Tax=Streptomyces sp. NPDC052682 TaxID=3154954 RepID=UPI003440A345